MKIKAEKKALLGAILPAMCALSTNAPIPILESLKLTAENSTLYVTGYDLSKGVKTETAVFVEEEGSILLNPQKISSIIRSMPDEVIDIATDNKGVVTVSCKKIKFEILGISPDGYPTLPELSGDKSFEIEKGVLKRACQQVLFSVALDDKKPVLTGVLFELSGSKMTLVSCDGFRLSICRESVVSSEMLRFIVPGKTLNDLIKLLEDSEEKIKIELTAKHLIVHFGDIYFFSRLVEGEYIDYMKSIPQNQTVEAKVKLHDFISCLERASLVIDERAKSPIKLNMVPFGILISCLTANGKIDDEVAAEVKGELEIGFNNRYLLDALKGASQADDEEVVLRMSGALVGMTIQPVDHDGYLYLVLPVRLNG